ncbi:hypothetical protein NM688_g1837 [Phlebia brevispora]|uniref:Uncharacterized protein n=1 Tax=Phlebia brevispora TaxID=194682 RepID=A0ACC1TAD0_9APHY|nr:hypothetical protein NM688_g1837 [Phlebia brevispora]
MPMCNAVPPVYFVNAVPSPPLNAVATSDALCISYLEFGDEDYTTEFRPTSNIEQVDQPTPWQRLASLDINTHPPTPPASPSVIQISLPASVTSTPSTAAIMAAPSTTTTFTAVAASSVTTRATALLKDADTMSPVDVPTTFTTAAPTISAPAAFPAAATVVSPTSTATQVDGPTAATASVPPSAASISALASNKPSSGNVMGDASSVASVLEEKGFIYVAVKGTPPGICYSRLELAAGQGSQPDAVASIFMNEKAAMRYLLCHPDSTVCVFVDEAATMRYLVQYLASVQELNLK